MNQFFKAIIPGLLLCLTTALKAQTGCDITLPYSTGFESDVSEQAPMCWTTLSGEAYAYNFVYYAHSGSQVLALNSSSGEARIATPYIPLPLNQIGVNLWYADLAWSTSGLMRVGFITSLSGTVQWIDTIPTSSDYAYYELDFSHLTITDTGYLVFSYTNSMGVGAGLVDDIMIFRNSSCSPVTNLHVTDLSNNEASIEWSNDDNSVMGYWCYIGDTNSRSAAFDSVFVSSDINWHTFTGLNGNTLYYVWVVSDCGSDQGLEMVVSFVTNPDCGGVRELEARSGYRQIGLNWERPAAGDSVTAYRVEYRMAGSTLWTMAETGNRYYFCTGLMPNTCYEYLVTTLCGDSTGIAVSGTAYTLGCTTTLIDSTGTHSYLPVAYSSGNSYSQQLYLSSELGGIDTITGFTFFLGGDYNLDTTPVVVYFGNTARTQFNSSTDYVPPTQLTQVYNGTIYNTGREVNVRLSNAFVRNTDSNLVVAIDNNLNDFAMTTPSFVVGNGHYRSIYRTSISDVNPSSPGYGTRINYVNRMRFNTTGCALPQCDIPVVCVSGIGTDYVDIAWGADSGSSYTCSYRTLGGNGWQVADSGVVGGTYRYRNLEAGYVYELRVSNVCGNDTVAGTTAATLPCSSVGVPYGENFENSLLNAVYARACWNVGTLSTSYFTMYPTVTTLSGSTNRVCQMTEAYLVLPRINQPLTQLQVRFDLYQTTDNDVLVLGVLEHDNDPINTATTIDSFAINIGTVMADTTFVYRLNNQSITDGHLVFYAPQGGASQYIDNIVVVTIPDCRPVEMCNVTAVTATSATLNWSGTDGLSATTGYVIEYGPRFFTPGSGTSETVYTTPYLLNGLEHSSDYDLYIWAVCGNDTSTVLGPVRFSTLCDAYNVLPYVMDFEGIQGPDYNVQSLPTCWYGGTTVNSPTLMYTTNTAMATTGGYCLHFHGQSIVALPTFNESLSDLKVQFHLYRGNPGTSTMIIGTVDSVTPGFEVSFSPIDTIPYRDGENEQEVTLYLADYNGTGTNLALRTIGPTYAEQYIDHVVIDRISECIPPQHVALTWRSATAATLSWRVSQSTRYRVEYGVQGFMPGSGTADTTNIREITLANLQPATTYDVHIAGLCDTSSSESTLFTFSTLRGIAVDSYPYHCTFADLTESQAWELDNGNQTNKWCIDTAAHSGNDDMRGLYISDNNGVENHYTRQNVTHAYAYRAFNMLYTTYHIHYDWRAMGESSSDYLRVFIVPASETFTPGYNPTGTTTTSSFYQSTPAGWIALDGGHGLWNETDWQTFDADFAVPEPGEYFLLFYWLNDGMSGTQPPAAVDNISIALRGCPMAEDLGQNEITQNSVSLTWHVESLAQYYLVEHGISGFAYGTGEVDTAYGSTYTVRGLEPGTTYDFYVTTVCGEAWYGDSVAVLRGISTMEIPEYTVTVLSNNNAFGSVEGGGIYSEGTEITLTAIPAEGYHFEQWDDGNAENPRSYLVTADVTLTAIFAPNVDIEEADAGASRIALYPNPATNTVTVNCGRPCTVKVIDVAGRTVIRQQCSESVVTIDISALTPGTYFVSIEGGTLMATQKLVKQLPKEE